MKKTVIIVNFIILCPLVMAVSLFLWRLKANAGLKNELSQKQQELQDRESASRRLKDLEKQDRDLKQQEESMYKMVPINEDKPFNLVKLLIKLGGEVGLRKITFNLQAESSSSSMPAATPGHSTAALSENSDMKTAAKLPSSPALAQTQAGLHPIYLKMDFEGTYAQLLNFLQRLQDMERIINTAAVKIQRSENILPYQKISMDLVAYTF